MTKQPNREGDCPSRLPEPPAQVAARKSKQRGLNRDHLRAHGWDHDAEAFVSAWRRGQIRVTFERIEKGEQR